MSAATGSVRFGTGVLRVFDLSLGQTLWSRRTLFLAFVAGAPVLVALVARTLQSAGLGTMRVDGADVNGGEIFGVMIWILYVRVIIPVLGVFYGTALIADEVEDKTLTYLFTRPIRRGAVLLGKYCAYLVCTGLVVLPSVLIVYFLIVPLRDVPATFPALLADLGVLALGLAVYGGVFALLGALAPRPLVAGLVFAFGWEQAAMLLPGSGRQLTVAHHLQALVPHVMPADGGLAALLQRVFGDTPGVVSSLVSLALIGGLSLVAAARVVERREYVLDQ